MYKKLLEYQEIDKNLKAMEDKLHGDESYKKYSIANKFLKTVNEKKAQIEDRAQYLMDTLEELSARYYRLVDEKAEFSDIDDIKEEATVTFLKKKAEELSNAFKAVEAEINALTKEMNNLVSQYKTLANNTTAMKEQRATAQADIEKLQAGQGMEKETITKKLADLEKQIDPALMAKYKDRRSKIKFPIVVVVSQGGVKHCLGCGTEFSSLEVANLKRDKHIECENCKKMIFLED